MVVTISALPRKGWDHLCFPHFRVHPLRGELGAAAPMVCLRDRSGNWCYAGRISWFTSLHSLFQGNADSGYHLLPFFSSPSPSHGINTYFFSVN